MGAPLRFANVIYHGHDRIASARQTTDLAAYKHSTPRCWRAAQVHSITTYVLMDSPKDERA